MYIYPLRVITSRMLIQQSGLHFRGNSRVRVEVGRSRESSIIVQGGERYRYPRIRDSYMRHLSASLITVLKRDPFRKRSITHKHRLSPFLNRSALIRRPIPTATRCINHNPIYAISSILLTSCSSDESSPPVTIGTVFLPPILTTLSRP